MSEFLSFIKGENGNKILKIALILGFVAILINLANYFLIYSLNPDYFTMVSDAEQFSDYVNNPDNFATVSTIGVASLFSSAFLILITFFGELSIINNTQDILLDEGEVEVKLFKKMFKNFGRFLSSMILYLGLPLMLLSLLMIAFKLDNLVSSIIVSTITSMLTYFAISKFFRYSEIDFMAVLPFIAFNLIVSIANYIFSGQYVIILVVSLISTMFTFIFIIYFSYQLVTTNEYKFTKDEI